jgi:hypothetical protein
MATTQNYYKVKHGLEVPSQDTFQVTDSTYPTIRPSLNLDFANSKVVDERITFTRSTNATYYDADGLLKTTTADRPRLDHDPLTRECKGLLIEEQRTNRALYTEHLRNSYWTNDNSGILIQNDGIAPNGMLTAHRLQESSTNSTHARFIKTSAWTDLSGTTFTFSIYVKSYGQKRNIFMLAQESGNAFYAHFDIVAGTVVQSATNGSGVLSRAEITDAGNGWFRISISGAINSSQIFTMIHLDAVGGVGFGAQPYQGDGVSGAYIWAPDIEAGSFATSYVPSTTTFTSRASSATYYDESGVLRIAGTNQPRYGYGYDTTSDKWISQGLVLEAAATNNITVSENFASGSWITGAGTKPTVTTGNLAPDNSLNATLVTPANTTFSRLAWQFTFLANSTLTFSIYVKAGNKTSLQFFTSQTNYTTFVVDLTNGAISSLAQGAYAVSGRTTKINDGWYRVEYTITNSTASAITETIAMGWDGLASTQTNYVWGAQFETGAVATSYIPTFGSTVTRAADVSSSAATTRVADLAYLQLENFTSWYNSVAGTAYAEWNPIGVTQPAFSFQKSTASTTNHWTLSSTSGTYSYFSSANGVPNGSLNGPPNGVLPGSFYKIAVAAQANNFAISLNGLSAASVSGGVVIPDVDRVVLTGTFNLAGTNAWMKKFSYYPIRLPNAQLQAITKQ